MVEYLAGDAWKWFYTQFQRLTRGEVVPELSGYEALMVALRLHVGGIDEQTLLNQELEKLRQTGLVAAYNTEFSRLYPGDQIPFRYLHYLYSRGLAKEIQAYMPLLNNSSPPADLRGLQRNAITAESLVAQSKGTLSTVVGRYSLASRQSQSSQ